MTTTKKTTKKTTPKSATVKKITVSKVDGEGVLAKSSEQKALEEKISKLESIINQLLEEKNVTAPEVLDADRDILFISMCYGILNLSTGKNGTGEVYTFNHIGEEILIPMSDAKAIVKSNRNFIKNGKVFIDDMEFIKKERLDSFYENILNWKGLKDLFTKDTNTFEQVFKSIPSSQQVSFKDVLAEKLLKGEKIDRNLIYIVNEALGINIEESIEFGKNLQ